MAGAMHKMAVYLGLVEDEQRFDDGYESYEEFEEYAESSEGLESLSEPAAVSGGHAEIGNANGHQANGHQTVRSPGPAVAQTTDLTRITTLHPRTYNEARTIGEHFREGTPVIMNLTEMVDSDAKRLVDFAAGLIFGLHGSIERVTNKVFLLSPVNVEVTAEDKARMAERGFFNQS
ncbi:MAG TPA: cell division protein SepF [Streptosporangiaceae bacterium]|nr:cell division protein SepF [Streptosporangiaceae bacterium]